MLVVALTRRQRAAAAQVEFVANQMKRAPRRARIGERSVISRSIFLLEACQRESGNGIFQIDLNQENRLSSRKLTL